MQHRAHRVHALFEGSNRAILPCPRTGIGMATPQHGILEEADRFAYFLVLGARDGTGPDRALARVVAAVPALATAVAGLDPAARLRCVLGIGARLWGRMLPGKRPRELRPFDPIDGARLHAPSTGGDVLLHIVSGRADLNFELARRARQALAPYTGLLEEVAGFRYLDSRDLTGFIDGTENPKGDERANVALVGGEDPTFAGGSYVLTQRYVHDLDRWARVPTAAQERVIGRTKGDSVELGEQAKPATAHISRVVIEADGR